MSITTLLAALVALKWGYNPVAVFAVNGFFLAIDIVFLGANSVKLFEGGWFPLVLAGFVAFLMLTWRKGNILVEEARATLRQPEAEFIEQLRSKPPITLPGNAAFLSSATSGIPLHLSRFVERSHALHKRILLVTALYEEAPSVPRTERAEVTEITPDIFRLVLHYGFMEDASIPDGLRCAVECGTLPKEFLDDLTIFIGHETIIPKSDQRGMATWRETIFAFLLRNAEATGAQFCIPTRQLVEVGTEIEI